MRPTEKDLSLRRWRRSSKVVSSTAGNVKTVNDLRSAPKIEDLALFLLKPDRLDPSQKRVLEVVAGVTEILVLHDGRIRELRREWRWSLDRQL
jgi:hypothetical protein